MSTVESLCQLIFNVYEAFTVAFFVKRRDMLQCAAAVSFSTTFKRSRAIPIEGTLPGWVLKHGEPLIIPNFDKDEETLGYYGGREEIKSFMAYPMDRDGIIIVDSKKKYVFTDKEKKILAGFASIIHVEIEREKRSQEMEERIDELIVEKGIISLFSGLNAGKVSVRDIFRESLLYSGADFCFVGVEKSRRIFIYDIFGVPAAEYAKKECSPRESIASLVMEAGGELLLPHNSGYLKEKPLFFPGEQIRARQFFGFPLIAEDTVMGVMGFGSLADTPLRDGSIGLLRNVSSLLSLYYARVWMEEHIEKIKEFDPVTGFLQFSTFLGLAEKMIEKGDRFHLLSVKLPHMDVYNRKMGGRVRERDTEAGSHRNRSLRGKRHLYHPERRGPFLHPGKGYGPVGYTEPPESREPYDPEEGVLRRRGMEGLVHSGNGRSVIPRGRKRGLDPHGKE